LNALDGLSPHILDVRRGLNLSKKRSLMVRRFSISPLQIQDSLMKINAKPTNHQEDNRMRR